MTSRFSDEFWSTFHREHGETVELPQAGLSDLLAGTPGQIRFDVPAVDGAADALDEPSLFRSNLPLALCVPDGYEPNYPYPLVIWLHGTGSSERGVAAADAVDQRAELLWPFLPRTVEGRRRVAGRISLVGKRAGRRRAGRTTASHRLSAPARSFTFTANTSTWPVSMTVPR